MCVCVRGSEGLRACVSVYLDVLVGESVDGCVCFHQYHCNTSFSTIFLFLSEKYAKGVEDEEDDLDINTIKGRVLILLIFMRWVD